MRRAPLWFVVLLAVVEACAWRALLAHVGGGHAPDAAPVAMAFWALFGIVASWIFHGLQAAGQAILQALVWSVQALWAYATAAFNATVAFGKQLLKGFRKAWDFLADTYTHVLRPAWQKFWTGVQRLRGWLEDTFRPVFDFLDKVRTFIRRVYDEWVRPVLDIIDATRAALRVLSKLGLKWAQRLDEWLGKLEERIDAPFRIALTKINEIVNLINRVVTADGLFQRLAMIRTLERDILYAGRALINARALTLTPEDYAKLRAAATARTLDDVRRDATQQYETRDGPYAALLEELAATGRNRLAR